MVQLGSGTVSRTTCDMLALYVEDVFHLHLCGDRKCYELEKKALTNQSLMGTFSIRSVFTLAKDRKSLHFHETLYLLYYELWLPQVIRGQTTTSYCYSLFSCTPVKNPITHHSFSDEGNKKILLFEMFITYHYLRLLMLQNKMNYFTVGLKIKECWEICSRAESLRLMECWYLKKLLGEWI